MFIYNEEVSEEEIINYGKLLEGKTLKDIGEETNVNEWLHNKSNKGAIGNAIQVCYFGIPANSIKDADFQYHHLELKVTPIKQNKNKSYSSKERLVLSIINYQMDWQYDFDASPLLAKSGQMLLVFYLHENGKDTRDYQILKVEKFTIPSEDLPTIREDYNTIIAKIKAGQAHMLSESDTTYLAACTKGAGKGKDFRPQSFSNEPAKQRAFSFKSKYMTNYFNTIFCPEAFVKLHMPKDMKLSDYLDSLFNKFSDLSTMEIENRLNFHPLKGINDDKGYVPRLVTKMLQVETTQLDNIEQFYKGNIKFKTIRLRQEKAKNQDMSWPNLDFHEISRVDFEDSSWYEWFAETKYLFVVFEESNKGNYFRKHLLWNMPYEELQELEKLYYHIKKMLQDGSIEITITTNRKGIDIWHTNFPKKGDFSIFQIRPKGNKGSEFTTLPDGRKIKKQCLFLNKEYLRSFI
ncbi:Sau3AI family type II restriction endonuclease [Lysinibacillus sphaericus]|uniref:Sau3AI family type II restriction endonuclease n=1 Tax=Lysinibacillus sphaericus TaxID=1421 RepID=UPI001C5EA7CB